MMTRRDTDPPGDCKGPQGWAHLARIAEEDGRLHDAARLWRKASGATLGHSRGTMYENNAAACKALHLAIMLKTDKPKKARKQAK